jgi:hypothetical protein
MIDRRLVHRRIGGVLLINDEDLVPALVLRRIHEFADLAQLFAEDWRRDRAVALPVACRQRPAAVFMITSTTGSPTARASRR